jgi:hypothetical protein
VAPYRRPRLEELRAEMMKHLGILIEGGLIDLEALLAEKRRTVNTIRIEGGAIGICGGQNMTRIK